MLLVGYYINNVNDTQKEIETLGYQVPISNGTRLDYFTYGSVAQFFYYVLIRHYASIHSGKLLLRTSVANV